MLCNAMLCYDKLCYATHLLQVAGGSGGDLGVTEDNLLSGTATEGAHDARNDLLLGDQAGVLSWDEPGESLGLATGDEGHLLDCIMACKPRKFVALETLLTVEG